VAIERWLSFASLGLFIMFVAQMISITSFLNNPSHDIDPTSQIREFVSISVAPALVLTGISFLLSRKYGSRLNGSVIITGGLVTLFGLYFVNTIVSKIPQVYLVPELTVIPTIFMIVSFPVMIVGCLLFRLKPNTKRDYFFDR
jgi:hypothetical protein